MQLIMNMEFTLSTRDDKDRLKYFISTEKKCTHIQFNQNNK